MTLRRIIVDFKKLTPEILTLLVDKYPYGYDDDQIISFRNAKNELIEAVEVRTEDTIYLVKVSKKLENSMEKFDVDDYEEEDMQDPISEIPEKADEEEALIESEEEEDEED
jgi:hypothetical protein